MVIGDWGLGNCPLNILPKKNTNIIDKILIIFRLHFQFKLTIEEFDFEV